ncbi:MAG TPA: ROK family protein [Solirubrobacteraceae bacterium]|nr:ROK family protein [Solirubrobacteraceae bacterium]
MPTECVIGIDLGGTNLRAAALDPALQTLARAQRVIAGLPLEPLVQALADAVEEVRVAAASQAGAEASAAGFGIPCMFDYDREVALSSTHLPLKDFPLAAALTERVTLPVFLDNDANVALLAELRHGAAQGASVAAMLTLGTGVGGGLAFGDEVFRGARGTAGELGHIIVSPDGPDCGPGCPGHGCLEALAGGSALARDARQAALENPDSALGRALADGREVDGALTCQFALAGDEVATAVLERLGEWLGIGIVTLVNALNPDVVVIGGGVAQAGELILAPARKVLAERGLRAPARHAEIRSARFGRDAGVIGAAVLARESIARRVIA